MNDDQNIKPMMILMSAAQWVLSLFCKIVNKLGTLASDTIYDDASDGDDDDDSGGDDEDDGEGKDGDGDGDSDGEDVDGVGDVDYDVDDDGDGQACEYPLHYFERRCQNIGV